MAILVTGGAGYIGSHTCVQLLEAGYDVVVVDNLCNSGKEALERVEELTGKHAKYCEADICDSQALQEIFKLHRIEAVIHFAGLKAVGESCQQPLSYYQNNVAGTLTLCEVMAANNCFKLVFSSSATVYGNPHSVPITEDFPLGATNPYGRTKLMVEQILTDLQNAESDKWSITLLRYFNPIGAHPSGRIGEDPNDIPNNLLPYVAQVATGKLEQLSVFGDDYNTPDGTGVRDYIHVMDLANGHIKALEKMNASKPATTVYNLGTGQGYSVLQIVNKFQEISGQEINYKIAPRRPGDIAECYANPERAQQELGWQCEYTLDDMIAHTWNWQKQNPKGYKAE